MNTDEALITLGDTTAEVVAGVMSSLCMDTVEKGQVAIVASSLAALESMAYPIIAADVSYTEGVSGGNVFAITRLGARRLAAAMMMMEPPTEDSDQELDEIEMSALGEAMNQMMAGSAGALAAALGYPVDISVPTTRVLTEVQEADGIYPQTPYVTFAPFTMLGESCRLIQLIPNAFVVRMARALDEGAAEEETSDHDDGNDDRDSRISFMLRDVNVRVAAELGRTTMSLEQLSEPRLGSVIELNSTLEDPIDLCVNGQRFATGQLFLIDQTEWAMRIEHVLDVDPADFASQTGGI
ncbi:MAG: FliM/FliN family flagellar motor switch protein [Solirubrobacteraceae bacterium]